MDDFLQIGKTLRTTREERQLAVEDAAHQTRIPVKIIRALEKDDYSVFSSSTYARSYLSQYSRYLELDPAPWLDAFEPAEFAHDYHGLSIIDEVEIRHASQRARRPAGTRWVPSFMGTLIAAAVVYSCYRLIENFEVSEKAADVDKGPADAARSKARPGADEKNPNASDNTAANPGANAVADQRSVASNSTGGAGQGPPKEQVLTDITPTSPPRAIIINEGED